MRFKFNFWIEICFKESAYVFYLRYVFLNFFVVLRGWFKFLFGLGIDF